MDKNEQRQLTNLFKALMHPARLEILDILRTGEECVCHIEAQLGYRQAYVSQQLAVLRDAGLVQDTRDGWNIYYRVIRPEVYALIDVARTMAGIPIHHPAAVNRLHNCPCPKCAAAAKEA